MHWIYAHLIGDYLLQNDWMAKGKRASSWICTIHVMIYMLPFIFTGLAWWKLLLIALQHWLQDWKGKLCQMSSGSFAGGVCEAREAMNRLIKILFLTTNPVNASKFHAETFGNPAGKMLVILHGGPGGDYRSLLNCKQFADHGYYVVFYDQRGSGLGWNLKLRKLAE